MPCFARSSARALDKLRRMIARLLIWLARGWQQGPSKVLPPSCRYQPSCSAYAITALSRYGAARGSWLAAQAHLPLPSVGRPGPRSGSMTRPTFHDEVSQLNDSKNMILAVVLSALVLLGWSLVSERLLPTAGPQTAARRERPGQAGAAAAGRPRRRPAAGDAQPRDGARRRRRGCGSTRRACRARSICRARGSTISSCCASAQAIDKNSPRGPAAVAGRRAVAAISPASAGPATALPRRPPTRVWTPSAPTLSPGKPVTLSWTSPQGIRFEQIVSVDDNYLFTVRQRVANPSANAVAVRPYGLISRANKSPDPTAGRCMSGRWAFSTARPITTSTGTRSTRPGPTASGSAAAAAGSASPTNIG